MRPMKTRSGWVLAALWAAGLLVSAYLTFEHFTGSQTLVCSEGQVVNCAAVTSSSYAYLMGVPVALLGLVYMAAGNVHFWLLSPRLAALRGQGVGAAYTGLGVLFVLYLIWAELQLRQLCSWCTVVHVVTAALFVIYLTSWLVNRD